VNGTRVSWGECGPPRPCDLFAPEDACAPREGCYLVDLEGRTECRVAGVAGPGEACDAQEDCRGGFFCAGLGERACLRVCRIDADDCPAGEGRCIAQAHSPEGTGFCTEDAAGGVR
jgi:hypothetical protein